jgi:hypothetical protein
MCVSYSQEPNHEAARHPAVASGRVKPTPALRPPAPGQSRIDAQTDSAGRTLSPAAVAKGRLMPTLRVRPPAPGQDRLEAQAPVPGAFLFGQVTGWGFLHYTRIATRRHQCIEIITISRASPRPDTAPGLRYGGG